MGVTAQRLAELYPRLYHMAEHGSWDSILKHGLLSTSALLDLFAVEGDERRNIELRRRDESRLIKHPTYGHAVIRDQKPIIESKLTAALQGCTPQEWYKLLNSRVFFWLTPERLYKLLSAREYRNKPHTVLTLETFPLARDMEASITLSRMNSGNTLPIAHPRGPNTFQPMKEYPFEERLRRRLEPVVELAVDGGFLKIADYVIRVETMISDGVQVKTTQVIHTG